MIITDSREQLPLFKEDVVVEAMKEGDYTIQGHEKCIVIERKTLSDWTGCVTGEDRKRVERELKRAAGNYRTFYLLIESDLPKMWVKQPFTKTHPSSVVGTSISWQEKYPWLKVVYASNRSQAKYFVKKLLEKHVEYCKEITPHDL